MFWKLLKYDFRSMFKQFAFIWPGALVLALINRFTITGAGSSSRVGETTAVIAMVVYVAILLTMFVVAVIFTIQRFYKGLLGDEGYLMHTLPVNPWAHITSKLVTACVATLVSTAVAVLSIIIIATNGWMPDFSDFAALFRGFRILLTHWDIHATQAVLLLVELVVCILLGMAQGYLHLYLAMALGHLFSKNRAAMSVVAYIGINAALSMAMSIFGSLGVFSYMNGWLDFFQRPGWGTAHMFMWVAIISQAALAAVFFAGTEYILRRKLNLE